VRLSLGVLPLTRICSLNIEAFFPHGSHCLDKFLLPPYIGSVSTVDYLPGVEKLELLQGTLEVLILRSLKLESNHAYGISQFLQQQSDSEFLVDNGSLYPALQRLLQRKWIAGQWKTSPNGRRARYYSLTPAGRRELHWATSKWQRFAGAMAKILAQEG
jgi:PadR family transcriptional regulator, regulatory protein PadR